MSKFTKQEVFTFINQYIYDHPIFRPRKNGMTFNELVFILRQMEAPIFLNYTTKDGDFVFGDLEAFTPVKHLAQRVKSIDVQEEENSEYIYVMVILK